MARMEAVNPVSLLNEQLRTNSLQKAYLLYGEEEYLKKEYADKIIAKTLGGEDDGFSLTKLDGDSYSVEAVTDGMETVSFFGGSKVLLLRNLLPEQLKGDGDILRRLLKEAENVRVIFYFDALYLVNKDYDKVRDRIRLLQSFSDCCTVLNFEHQSHSVLTRWAETFFTKNRVSITSRAVAHLVDLCGCDMGKLRGEAVKVASISKEGDITESDVDKVVSPSIEVNIFVLAKDIMEMHPKHMMKTLQDARQTKESPTKLLYNLTSAFCEMTYVKLGVSGGKTVETVMKDFHLPQSKTSFLRGYASACREISVRFFIRALDEISACDRAFKGGDGESWERLELLCLNLLFLRKKQEKR